MRLIFFDTLYIHQVLLKSEHLLIFLATQPEPNFRTVSSRNRYNHREDSPLNLIQHQGIPKQFSPAFFLVPGGRKFSISHLGNVDSGRRRGAKGDRGDEEYVKPGL